MGDWRCHADDVVFLKALYVAGSVSRSHRREGRIAARSFGKLPRFRSAQFVHRATMSKHDFFKIPRPREDSLS